MYCLFCMVFPELLLYWLFYDNKSIVLIALILSLPAPGWFHPESESGCNIPADHRSDNEKVW